MICLKLVIFAPAVPTDRVAVLLNRLALADPQATMDRPDRTDLMVQEEPDALLLHMVQRGHTVRLDLMVQPSPTVRLDLTLQVADPQVAALYAVQLVVHTAQPVLTAQPVP